MKNYFMLLLVCSFIGCKQGGNGIDIDLINYGSPITTISAVIPNWAYGDDKFIKLGYLEYPSNNFIEFGSSHIEGNGYFNVALKIPSTNYLFLITKMESIDSVKGLKINDTKVKGLTSRLFIFDSDSLSPIGSLDRCNISQPLQAGNFASEFIYSDGNMDITGEITDSIDYYGKTLVVSNEYNLHYKTGWNQRFLTLIEKDTSGNILFEKWEISNIEPKSGAWILSLY